MIWIGVTLKLNQSKRAEEYLINQDHEVPGVLNKIDSQKLFGLIAKILSIRWD